LGEWAYAVLRDFEMAGNIMQMQGKIITFILHLNHSIKLLITSTRMPFRAVSLELGMIIAINLLF